MSNAEVDWAPCAHTDEENLTVAKWIRDVLQRDNDHNYDNVTDRQLLDGFALESVFWHVSDLPHVSVSWGFGADQWVGVGVTVELYLPGPWTPDKKPFKTVSFDTQADNFTLAVVRLYERILDLVDLHKTAACYQHPEGCPQPGDIGDSPSVHMSYGGDAVD